MFRVFLCCYFVVFILLRPPRLFLAPLCFLWHGSRCRNHSARGSRIMRIFSFAGSNTYIFFFAFSPLGRRDGGARAGRRNPPDRHSSSRISIIGTTCLSLSESSLHRISWLPTAEAFWITRVIERNHHRDAVVRSPPPPRIFLAFQDLAVGV